MKGAMLSPIRTRRERGFLMVTYTVMIAVMVGFAGLAVDAGYLQWAKRRTQVAADAAAMGALRELERRSSNDAVVLAGRADAGLNGFTNGLDQTVVDILNPPASGQFTGNSQAVQAVVERAWPTIFMRIFGRNSVTMSARAVARTATAQGSRGACIFALNPTMKSALQINGTTIEMYTQCDVMVKSNHTEAFTLGSSATVYVGHQAKIGVVGGWAINGGSSIRDEDGDTYEPVRVQDFGDPFATLPEPSPSNVTTTVRGNNVRYDKNQPPANNLIAPGVYCGGIDIGDTNGQTYTFQAGTFVLAGGGLTINSSARVAGTGVMFYNTEGGSGWGCGNSNYKPVTINGQSGVSLSAPTSGTFSGILMFESRAISSNQFNQIVGGGSGYFDGGLYFRNTALKFAGNSSNTGALVLVADNISILGTTTLKNYFNDYVGSPVRLAPYATGGGLVE
jgi:hypothetical protein